MPTSTRLALSVVLIGAALTSGTSRQTSAAPGPILVAAYSFNEGSGSILSDVSGNNNHGALANGPIWIAGGKFGGALTFDGTNDLITINDSTSLDLTSGMTLEAWVNPKTLGGYRSLLLKERPGHLSYALYANTNTNRPSVEIATTVNTDVRGTAQLKLATWTHVASTYDGARLSFYINGALISSKAVAGGMVVSNGALRIGGNLVWGEYFNGSIDEVRIYNGALTQAQIQTDMNTPVNPAPPDTIPPAVSMTAPTDGTAVAGTVSVSAQASDNVGVAAVQFLLNGANLAAEDSTAPYSISWNTTTVSNGSYTLAAKGRDVAGNIASSSGINVIVNNPPRLVITQPAQNVVVSGTTVDVAYSTVGDATDVVEASLQLDGNPIIGDTTFDGLYTFFDVPAGPHVLNGFLRSMHAKIDGSDASPVSFTSQVPDNVPPAVAITNPGAGSTVTGIVDVIADASDNTGVTAVQFVLDGMNLGASDSSSPYAVSWTTSAVANGSHVLTAVAFDASMNRTTSAPVTVNVSNTDPAAQVGQWAPTMDWPIVAVHAALLSTGKVLAWEGYDGPNSLARLWNPQTNAIRTVVAPGDLFCAGLSQLPDGRLLVTGGHGGGEVGTPETNIFDPLTETWTRVSDMKVQRWYPSNIPLADGRTIALSGQITSGVWADTPEIYDPKTNVWAYLAGVNTSDIHDHEYALSYGLPNGKVFVLGASPGVVRIFDPLAGTWTAGAYDTKLLLTSAVMYRPGKVLASGGGDKTRTNNSATSALVIDATAANSAWRQVSSMAYPRYQHNLLTLPDGKVLAVGGSTILDQSSHSGSLAAEIWDPTTETWSTMASMRDPRMYHSTAVLLPDGRVLSAGGGREGTGTNYLTAQLFSPPYLFKGARPAITAAPALADYRSTITVTTPNASDISMVSLVSLTATTHTLDGNQHFVELSFTRNAADLSVTMPTDGNVAPPGYYMLFIVNGQGVPSTAAMVRLPAPGEDTQPPTAPTNLSASTSGSVVSLTWTAATDNVAVTKYDIHRGTTAGFNPSPSTLIAQSAATNYSDVGVSGTAYYKVTAEDTVGNIGGPSNEVTVVLPVDATPPTVSITAPLQGNSVTGNVTVAAQASDDIDVSGVQFLLDGANLGTEDTTAPYSTVWDTAIFSNGTHTLSARARDVGGNTATSGAVTVTVSNAGLIDFNGLTNVQAPLNGQYPTGVVNWGTNLWWLSGPWGQFSTNSISFNGPGMTSAAFTLVNPRRLISLKAFNGGNVASTITLSCAGNTSKSTSVAVNQLVTISTSWIANCSTVTVGSSNGWDTNFDDLVYDQVP